jgi:hypothetical protein
VWCERIDDNFKILVVVPEHEPGTRCPVRTLWPRERRWEPVSVIADITVENMVLGVINAPIAAWHHVAPRRDCSAWLEHTRQAVYCQ